MHTRVALPGRLEAPVAVLALILGLTTVAPALARMAAPAAAAETRVERSTPLMGELGAADLATTLPARPPEEESEEPVVTATRPAGFPDLGGSSTLLTGAGVAKGPTPQPALKFDTDLVGNDPQIAVGHSYVVVTSYNTIEVYDKTGHKLKPKKGTPFANPFSTLTLYKPAWKPGSALNINAHLNLPPNLR